jgi:hypothetical protein
MQESASFPGFPLAFRRILGLMWSCGWHAPARSRMMNAKIEIGKVYSAKVGGAYVAVQVQKSLGHGRYEGVGPKSGEAYKFSTDVVRGEGMTLEDWTAKHAPVENGLPVPEAGEAAPPTPKAKMGRKPKGEPKERKPSGLDAAVRVLREAGKPMKIDEVVKAALEKGYWQTSGKTPAGTIYAAIIREIAAKGTESRFRRAEVQTTTDGQTKTERAYFELTEAGKAVTQP